MPTRSRASKQPEDPAFAPAAAESIRGFASPPEKSHAGQQVGHSFDQLEAPAGFESPAPPAFQLQKSENRTGMPDRLKSGLENLSGMDLSGVRVHRNSDKPAQVQALAYTQGSNIHVAPGQDKHLPHESWHAVQQMQGRVKPTMKAHGVAINDSPSLEKEADVMGKRALQTKPRDR